MFRTQLLLYPDSLFSSIEVIVMVDVQTISVVIAAASVVVGVITFIMNSRKEARQRQMEFMFWRLQRSEEQIESFGDVLFVQDWKNWEDLQEKYSWSKNPKGRARWLYYLTYYNTLGLTFKEQLFDPNLFFSIITPAGILTAWRKYETIIPEIRRNSNNPNAWNGFEYLANETKRRYPKTTVVPAG
jgi:hypothetical protein